MVLGSISAAEFLSLMEFLTYMSVFINECNGNLANQSERFGNIAHPGISYLFDSFEVKSANGHVWRKKSYNQNMSCFDLFHDQRFISAHSGLPLSDKLANTTDDVWRGASFPKDAYPTGGD